jgi:homocysteine S-methyltransferase
MEIALRARREIDDGLAICSFACAAEGRLSSGLLLGDAFAKLRALNAQVVGVNCTNGLEEMVQVLHCVPDEYLLCAYPNAGIPKYHAGRFIYEETPDQFAQATRKMVAEGARLIGGCCGTTPKHIAAMAAAMANLKPDRGTK